MPPRTRTVPIVSGEGPDLCLSVTDTGWQQAERALGKKISPTIRDEIIGATERFLRYAPYEREAEPIGDVEARIRRITKAAQQFLAVLIEDDMSDARIYADQLIERRWNHLAFGELEDMMMSFVAACENSNVDRPGFQPGQAWDRWIRDLTDILRKHHFHTGVRKDSDKTADASPFVRFVAQMQEQFPKDLRRHLHSETALTVAISRARSGHKAERNTKQ